MERSSDATKALRELRYNGCKLYGQKLIILRSQKYKRLTTGLVLLCDSKSDRKKDHLSTRSSSRIRSGRTSSHSKSVAKDDKTKEKDDKTKEKDDKTKKKDGTRQKRRTRRQWRRTRRQWRRRRRREGRGDNGEGRGDNGEGRGDNGEGRGDKRERHHDKYAPSQPNTVTRRT
ncbi:uncharacterized protein [Salvelinus sp. IW2-2015]|uniref:uncharacterized protein n=1 Tax=Salvelinus sp. IW2-2015 TaxID=2691554 RepID=UPI0038D44D1F